MREKVLVIGAGIGGLCTALMLAPSGREIIMIERDGPLDTSDPDELFRNWKRNGVAHLRQSHAFLARLRVIMKEEHPALIEQLLANGVRELPFDIWLTEQQEEGYQPEPEDEDLTMITSRRTTLEMTMRRYVETLPNVRLQCGIRVERLLTRKGEDGMLQVYGVQGMLDGAETELHADIVVDASGKGGRGIKQLIDEGAVIKEESESAGILYFTRHYRLLPGQEEPDRRSNPPASGDLGYLKFGVFPGDNGNFSITLAVPEVELELRQAIVDPEIFHAITLMLPGLFPWTNATRSEPTGKVIGMGDLVSRWRDMVVDGKPAASGYFALGDTLVRTNPLFGRGCSFAAVSAQSLRKVLDAHSDPTERAIAFHEAIKTELRPFYLNQRQQDRAAIKEARRALTPGARAKLRTRLTKSFIKDGIEIAIRSDTKLLREALRGFHMLEHPDAWLRRPRNLGGVLYYWARGKRRNAAAYRPDPGPERKDMLRRLQIDFQADIDRIAIEQAKAA